MYTILCTYKKQTCNILFQYGETQLERNNTTYSMKSCQITKEVQTHDQIKIPEETDNAWSAEKKTWVTPFLSLHFSFIQQTVKPHYMSVKHCN